MAPTSDTTKNAASAPDPNAAELLTTRIRELNERVINSSKGAGLVALGAYEKALSSLADFEEKAAGATQLDWVAAVASTHARFIQDLSASYTNAARDLLK